MKQTRHFWAKVVKGDGCWLWMGAHSLSGYSRLGLEYAHRISYRMHFGEIPDGKEIDHMCHTRGCVNPNHLRAVSHAENMWSGNTNCALNKSKTHCKRGHEFTAENTIIEGKGRRCCLACRRVRYEMYKAGKRAGFHRYTTAPTANI